MYFKTQSIIEENLCKGNWVMLIHFQISNYVQYYMGGGSNQESRGKTGEMIAQQVKCLPQNRSTQGLVPSTCMRAGQG